MQIFTDEWAQAFCDGLNQHPYFKEAAAKWNSGPIALIARYNQEEQEDVAFLVGLDGGIVHFAAILSDKDAIRAAKFVFEASCENWDKLFCRSLNPFTAYFTGRLKLIKGNVIRLYGMEKAGEFLFNVASSLD